MILFFVGCHMLSPACLVCVYITFTFIFTHIYILILTSDLILLAKIKYYKMYDNKKII